MIAQLSTGATINLPLTAHEIPWEAFCDFKDQEQEYFKAIENENGFSELITSNQAMIAITKALEYVFGDWIITLPFALEEPSDDLFLNGFTVTLGDDLSVMRLYAHLNTVINTFKPETLKDKVFKLVIGGEEYQLDQLKAAKFLTLEGVSTGEAIEVLEFRRIAEKNLEEKKFALGSMDFTLGLRELAILVRKKGESLPWNRKELESFLNDRMQTFRTVTAGEVLTLRFFLINSYLLWLQSQITNSSGTVRPIKVQELSRKKPGIVKRRRGKRLS
jgi:hypothetical protein